MVCLHILDLCFVGTKTKINVSDCLWWRSCLICKHVRAGASWFFNNTAIASKQYYTTSMLYLFVLVHCSTSHLFIIFWIEFVPDFKGNRFLEMFHQICPEAKREEGSSRNDDHATIPSEAASIPRTLAHACSPALAMQIIPRGWSW